MIQGSQVDPSSGTQMESVSQQYMKNSYRILEYPLELVSSFRIIS